MFVSPETDLLPPWLSIFRPLTVYEGSNFFISSSVLIKGGLDGKASVYNTRDSGSIPGLGRSPGEGNGNPLQYYCLENPMDRGAWNATVHGVTKSRTRLSDFTHSALLIELKWYLTVVLIFIVLMMNDTKSLFSSFENNKSFVHF